MACPNCAHLAESCAELSDMTQSLCEEVLRLKRSNTALRTVKSSLYTRIKALQNAADSYFLILCDTDNSSEGTCCQ